tara:strand:+ start:282 stop:740 length:459 start_codon:yes stop_codon:yes gene_type:complete
MINENLKLSGQLNIVLKDKTGSVKDQREIKNLVVNTGLAYIASRMTGTAKAVMTHMAVGSGTTAAAATQTDLVSILGSREVLDSTTISGSNNEKVVYISSFEAGDGTGAVTEAGLFNASSGGDMLCRTVFSVVNKAADDTMSITWTITLSAS